MSITTASQSQLGQETAKNSQIVTTSVKLVSSGASIGSSGPSISSIVITDSGWTAIDDTAVGTSNSYIKILGSNFTSTSNVYIGGVQVATANVTYVSASELRVILPPSTAGVSNTVSVFTSTGSGTIAANTLLTSGFPSFTSTSYSSTSYTVSTQLLATGDGTLTYSLKSGSTLPAGLSLAANGLISGTVSGDTTNTFTVLVNDDQSQTTQADITLSVIGTDSYFKNNMLLISADGTNDANNNVFVDSSGNNLAITRRGNLTQGSFSPFSTSGWGNEFDGNGDYLAMSASSNFALGAGDFTVEFWAFPRASTSGAMICVTRLSNGGAAGTWGIYCTQSGGLNKWIFTEIWESATTSLTSSSNYSLNTWVHIAYVRQSGTLKLYINGTLDNSVSSSTNFNNTSYPFEIASDRSGIYWNGILSNLRIVKGTAVYTGNFTPPTAQLTAVANTTLLTCQSNRFLDTSNSASGITVNGDSKVTNFNPFAPTAIYSTASYGSSGYFDGTGDYLSFTVNQTPLLLGNSDFTFEAWVYPFSSTGVLLGGQSDFNSEAGSSYGFGYGSIPGINDLYGAWAGGKNAGTPTPILRAWNHVAWVRTGGTYSAYLNGTRIGTNATLGSSAVNNGSTNYEPTFGASSGGNNALNGYAVGRLIKGSNGYNAANSTITVPTTPFTAVSNTSVLLNFDNGNIFDATQKNVFETLANAKLSTSVKKYGTASLYLDGSNSYLKSPTTINMGTSDFTIEAWVYPTSRGNADGGIIVGQSLNGIGTDYLLYITQSGYLSGYFLSGGSAFTFSSSGTVSLNTWTHVALTRSGSTFKLWINGVNDGTTTSSATITNSNGPLAIGYASNGIGNGQFFGYIDDLRITRGVARYVANFTPPTSSLQLS